MTDHGSFADHPPPPAPATKRCPACAEEIQAAAMVCRYCGFNHGTGTMARAMPAQPATTSGFAVAALVLGILTLWGVGSILALIFGYKARNDIDASQGALKGRGMATAGVVLGWIGIGLMIFVFIALANAS